MKEFHGFEVIHPNEIEKYNFSGVWAMLGKEKADKKNRKYKCLNVGKSICISDEVKIDFDRLKNFELCRKKEYRNQFGEIMFIYDEYATRQDMLYKNISQKYEEIIFILVSKQSENTYEVEKYFAYSTKASYWVTNGRKKLKVEDDEIKNIIDGMDASKIGNSLINKINELKGWLDN